MGAQIVCIVLFTAVSYSSPMHKMIILVAVVCCVAWAGANAEVYKRTNPDGSVEFTDVPDNQETKPVELSPMSTYPAPPAPQPTRSRATSREEAKQYDTITITSPANDDTIRDNQGNLTITVDLSPGLKSGHNLVILLDGSKQAEGKSTTVSLSNIDRGSHQIQAQVVDAEGKSLAQSESITVHLKRFSQLFKKSTPPPASKPAKAIK